MDETMADISASSCSSRVAQSVRWRTVQAPQGERTAAARGCGSWSWLIFFTSKVTMGRSEVVTRSL
jgi:hypothetical protein